MCVQGRWNPVNLATRRTHAAVIILLRRCVHCRSVLRAQGGCCCDCMTRLSALRACAEPSVVWQSVFRTIAGQAEPECFPTPDFVVCARGIRTGCGSWHRMWGVIAPFSSLTYIRYPPPKRPRPYSRPLRRSCESSLPHAGPVIRSTEIPRLLEWCCG